MPLCSGMSDSGFSELHYKHTIYIWTEKRVLQQPLPRKRPPVPALPRFARSYGVRDNRAPYGA